MEFRFNFATTTDTDQELPTLVDRLSSGEGSGKNACSAVEVSCVDITLNNQHKVCHLTVGDCHIAHICTDDLHKNLDETEDNKRITLAINSHSDLVPGVYEGGLKIWECTLDLIHYLDNHNIFTKDVKVLELGCGAGLVGIYAYLKGAKVDFQDYNEEVLRLLTVKNVLLNTDNQDVSTLKNYCRFFAGDWEAVDEHFCKSNPDKHKYDIVVTSETIYNPNNQIKLLNLMKSALKPEGIIYVAAKSYYFGVGGSTQQFEEVVRNDGTFDIVSGLDILGEIPRKIIVLQFRKDLEV